MKYLNKIDYIIIITLSMTLLYVLPRNLPAILGSFRFFWAPLTLVTIILQNPKFIFKQPLKLILSYGVIIVGLLQNTLWNYMSYWTIKNIESEFYYIFIFSTILFYYLYKQKRRSFYLVSQYSLMLILLSVLSTNIVLFYDPLIIRNSAARYLGNVEQIKISNLYNTLTAGGAQAIVMLIPYFVFVIRKRLKNHKIAFMALGIIVITAIRGQVFGNLLATIIALLLSLVKSKYRKLAIINVVFIVLMVSFIPNAIVGSAIRSFSVYFSEDSIMREKINDFALFVEITELDDSTGAGGRVERYPLLFGAFIKNPFFGSASYDGEVNIDAGAHLYWMNRLANWGIFGFMFFLFVLYKITGFILSSLDNNIKYYYKISILVFIALGIMKTYTGREPWVVMIIVLPGLYLGALEEIGKSRVKKQIMKTTST